MLRKRILAWSGVLIAALVLAAPAAAQNDDPQVDPDSPAGTEYQLPIDRARRQAGGGGSGGGDGQAPPFGAGVERTTPRSDERRRSGSGANPPAPPVGSQQDLGESVPEIVQTPAPESDSGGIGLLTIGAGAAGVLLIGGLAGLGWRRRASGSMRR